MSYSSKQAHRLPKRAIIPIQIWQRLRTATNDATISFEQAFDLLKDVDSDQINLELAEQYLDLGEYDSAKRLLNEIQANNNSEYAARVEQLLEKIG